MPSAVHCGCRPASSSRAITLTPVQSDTPSAAAVMALSDEIVVLHHGMVLAKGTPDQVTRDERVIEAYLGEEQLIAES